MTVFGLKLIAMSSMLIDHIGFGFFDDNYLMRSIGRLAFILYAFLMAESYAHLQDKPDRLKAHGIKLLILCVVSEIPFDLFDHKAWVDFSTQNAVITLLLGYLALIASGEWKKRWKQRPFIAVVGPVLICALAAASSYWLKSEYKFAGVLLIIFFYLYLRKADHLTIPMRFLALVPLYALYVSIYIWSRAKFGGMNITAAVARGDRRWLPGMLCAMILIAFYNRKLGYHSKWFSWLYSVFYPLQFVVLLIVSHYMQKL